jgi:eukaryotic-like serine/threonine-protein kinase
MALASGSYLGSYAVLSPLGAGGMGEVYRARDSKLGRDVALKVLPEVFARDAERMARFQREAKVLASLNHPNIASIYGLEDSGATHALVMELVEGPTLADRIKQGAIPVDEALRIAKQIADALEYAHERGIVHRDLKPANVKVTSDDAVKVLDFGLAKAVQGEASEVDISSSPTMTRMATLAGVLLGTAAYMSPEQAKAKPVDRRADIWAFGCVLYEMLTGKMAFSGETVTDTLAAIIKEEPDWSRLPAGTPVRVRLLLQRCLQKDPKQRLRDIGDARISLEEVLSGAAEQSSVVAMPIAAPVWYRALPWVVAACFAIALAVVAGIHFRAASPPQFANAVRFQIPITERLAPGGGNFALSPDGRHLAFPATGPDGVSRLWIRSLDSLEERPLPGSESSVFPPFFWSPDSRYIVFDGGGKLKKIDTGGGPAQTLCEISHFAVGGSWNQEGTIVFGSGNGGGLQRVSANGGPSSPVTVLDPSGSEVRHDFPLFLPDGRHFIYQRTSNKPGNSGIYVGSLDAKPEEQSSKRLLETALGGQYVSSSDPGTGQLLFLRDGTLMAQTFDTNRLELSGEPVAVAQHVGSFLDSGFFSVSTNGVLVYRTGSSGGSRLEWIDGQGKAIGTAGEPAAFYTLSLSPDGSRAVFGRLDSQNPAVSLWLLDLSRGTSARFTFDSFDDTNPVWSPDGNHVAFGSARGGPHDLYQKLASGVGDEEVLLKSDQDKYPESWSRDGRFLIFESQDPKTTNSNLWVLPLEGDRKPFPFAPSEFNNRDGQFSPDGRRIAYVSDESGRDEIYVRTFSPDPAAPASDAGGKWLISTAGGREPRWSADGKLLYYLAFDGKLMAVKITMQPVFRAEVPGPLFQTPPASSLSGYGESWDVTRDGKRFLFLAPIEQAEQTPFTVVLNWQAGLKK